MTLSDRFKRTKYVTDIANAQKDSYRHQPLNVIGDYRHEHSIADAYRGRQILELLQNADDAGNEFDGPRRVLFRLTASHLIAANTGKCFDQKGVRSLVVSDVSPKLLSRQRYIGNKGLGFRSILTWSPAPLIMSGDFLVAFDPGYAREAAFALASELPESELGEEMEMSRRDRGVIPAATMRFPFIPDADDERVRIGLDVLKEGYNTVIVLPLAGEPRRERVREEILSQLEEVAGETVLFCRNLETLSIEGREHRSWSVIREGPEERQTVLITHTGQSNSWTVLRETGTLSPELVGQDLHETRDFEIAVGLPASTVSESRHKLCVYFPTDDLLPAAMVAHATLSTDDSRKRLIRHDANRFILKSLAELMAKAAEQESTSQSPSRGLELLSGAERCEQELIDLGFRDALMDSCRARNLCPRLDGSFGSPPETMRPRNQVWGKIATASHFPDMLIPGLPERAQSFLAALELPWYDPETLGRLLESFVRGLSPSESGRVVGQLAEAEAIPEGPPHLLLGSDGKFLSDNYTVFLTPRKDNIKLPEWVQDFRFAHPEFMGALRHVVGDIREARELLNRAGYKIDSSEKIVGGFRLREFGK